MTTGPQAKRLIKWQAAMNNEFARLSNLRQLLTTRCWKSQCASLPSKTKSGPFSTWTQPAAVWPWGLNTHLLGDRQTNTQQLCGIGHPPFPFYHWSFSHLCHTCHAAPFQLRGVWVRTDWSAWRLTSTKSHSVDVWELFSPLTPVSGTVELSQSQQLHYSEEMTHVPLVLLILLILYIEVTQPFAKRFCT